MCSSTHVIVYVLPLSPMVNLSWHWSGQRRFTNLKMCIIPLFMWKCMSSTNGKYGNQKVWSLQRVQTTPTTLGFARLAAPVWRRSGPQRNLEDGVQSPCKSELWKKHKNYTESYDLSIYIYNAFIYQMIVYIHVCIYIYIHIYCVCDHNL